MFQNTTCWNYDKRVLYDHVFIIILEQTRFFASETETEMWKWKRRSVRNTGAAWMSLETGLWPLTVFTNRHNHI